MLLYHGLFATQKVMSSYLYIYILLKALKELNIVGPVTAEISEDETSIERIPYNQVTDELLDVCGESGNDLKVGDGIEGYNKIVRTIDNMVNMQEF